MSRDPAGGESIEAIIVEGFTPAVGLEPVNGTLLSDEFAEGTLFDGIEAGGLGAEFNGLIGSPKLMVPPEIGVVSVSSLAGVNAGGGLTADLRFGLAFDSGELAGGGDEFGGAP